VKKPPVRAGICHCKFCQRRTGSAFGIGVWFREEDVEFTQGKLKSYEHRSDESNRWLRMEFCPDCGTTVSWTVELRPGLRSIGGGTFDDPSAIKLEWQIWTRSAQPWLTLPADIATYPEGVTR
jgi:hypothetical protein